MFKTGFIAVIGKPNVGKSSLINELVGEKVSITGPKAQTTRTKIIGIKNEPDYQMVFLDTPGVQAPKNKLGEYMKQSTDTATQGIDALIIVLDATRIDERDYKLIEKYEHATYPVFVVINKIDLTSYVQLFPELDKLNKFNYVKAFFTLSAKKKKHIDKLQTALVDCLSEGEPLYPTDTYTDKTVRFMASEIIREKALLYLQEEVPHGIAVDIVSFEEDLTCATIEAELIVEREAHKAIVIGSEGNMLKKIGTMARHDLEELLEVPVMLKLFVKAKQGWRDDTQTLSSLGYNVKDLK
ncbi:MAG: GTPase Era [Clostridia bacterium]